MKRLLLITIDFPPATGGVARYLYELSRYFGEEMEVVHEERALLYKYFWPRWLKALCLTLRKRKTYDFLIVSHVLPLGIVALINQRLTKKPYVVILHGMDFALARRNGWKQKLTRMILRGAHVVIANSENLAREVLGFAKPREIDVVYPCLSEELVTHASKFTRDQSVEIHEEQKPVRFLTVARLVPRKGHSHVLDALALLKSDHRIGAFVYHIVGNGPIFAELEAHVKDLNLSKEVKFIRDANDAQLVKEYESADVFVMPTEHMGKDIEGFGTVYVEAAAFALPAIASALPGVDEAVIDKATGLLVPSSSVTDLAEAMERLAGDPGLRIKLGQAGRERSLNEFVCEKQFTKLRELL